MEEIEKMKLTKSIVEIQNKIINYDRNSAIELIKRVREDHKGKEQIAYVLNNIPLEMGTDEMIIKTLQAEEIRLTLKLKNEQQVIPAFSVPKMYTSCIHNLL